MRKDRLKVVGLGGSLAQHSTSLAALRIALEGAAGTGAITELLDIKELSLPMYDPPIRILRSRSDECVIRSMKQMGWSGAVQCTTARSVARSRTHWTG